jgi:hypothetical protein
MNWTWKKCLGAAILLSPFAGIFVAAHYTLGFWGAVSCFGMVAAIIGLIKWGCHLFYD